MHRRWMRLLGALFALTMLAAACGGNDTPPAGNGGSPSESASSGGGSDLTIVDFAFTTDDGAVDQTISPGETADVTLTGVTSGGFHCRFHSQMTGTLTVA